MKRGQKRVTVTGKMAGETKREEYWTRWAQIKAQTRTEMGLDKPSQIIHLAQKVIFPKGHRPEWCPVCRKKVCVG